VKRILSWLRHEALGILGVILAIVGVASAVWIAYGQNRLDRDLARAQDQLARDLATAQDQLARDLANAGEIQENLRFVRQVAISDTPVKPFSGLNLNGAVLGGLDLGCAGPPRTSCTDLSVANLTSADLSGANLTGANLKAAKLTDADLSGANLRAAKLTSADLGCLLRRLNDLASRFHAAAASLPCRPLRHTKRPGRARPLPTLASSTFDWVDVGRVGAHLPWTRAAADTRCR
jgi:hypothetical protein